MLSPEEETRIRENVELMDKEPWRWPSLHQTYVSDIKPMLSEIDTLRTQLAEAQKRGELAEAVHARFDVQRLTFLRQLQQSREACEWSYQDHFDVLDEIKTLRREVITLENRDVLPSELLREEKLFLERELAEAQEKVKGVEIAVLNLRDEFCVNFCADSVHHPFCKEALEALTKLRRTT